MHNEFTSDFYIQNRKRLMASLPGGAMVVMGGSGLMQRTADTTFAFVQHSSFWYLTGIEEPGIVLVISKDTSYCILPPANDMLAVFDGAPIAEILQEISGVDNVLSQEAGWKQLKHDIDLSNTIYLPTLPSTYDERHGLYVNPAPLDVAQRVRKLAKKSAINDTTISRQLAYARSIKQPVEISAIEKAVELTMQGLQEVSRNYASYEREYEIEAELSKHFRLAGGRGHAFSPIVANGAHATTLHYVSNNGTIDHTLPTVVDVGADYTHYAADITRTILPATASKRQKAVYSAVERVQQYALTKLKPGITLAEYEKLVERNMAEELVALGLIANPNDQQAVRTYFPHASSHFLGLDVHDAGLYEKPLEPNMVLTCEPGIYIPEEQFGVRIEDDVLLTDTGNRVLSL